MARCKAEVDSVIRIPTSLKDGFFQSWFDFLHQIHHLTKRETEVIACLARHRHELSKVIKDDAILDRETMGDQVKKEVIEELKITPSFYQQILGKLKKNNIIVNGVISKRYLPPINEQYSDFRLLLKFEFEEDGHS